MLVRFRVENFRSFRDEFELNMLATDDDSRHPNHVWTCPITGTRLLRAAAIYGPNAGGKSNLVKAFGLFYAVVANSELNSDLLYVNDYFKPFGRNQPISIEIIILEDGKFYFYGLSFLNRKIINEWLYLSDNLVDEYSLIFERKNEIDFVFSDEFNDKLDYLKGVYEGVYGQYSKVFLSEIAKRDKEEFRLFSSVMSGIKNIFPVLADMSFMISSMEILKEYMLGDNVVEKIRQFGINIASIGERTRKIKTDVSLEKLSTDLDNANNKKIKTRDGLVQKEGDDIFLTTFTTTHDNYDIYFDMLTEESDGTLKLIEYIPILFLSDFKSFFIDEIDRSLHTLLSYQLIEDFLKEKQENQLIFTTHDTNLITLDLLRQDEIFFIQKDDTGNSYIYSLSDFRPDEIEELQKANQLEKGYLLGRFGAIPNLKKEKV